MGDKRNQITSKWGWFGSKVRLKSLFLGSFVQGLDNQIKEITSKDKVGREAC